MLDDEESADSLPEMRLVIEWQGQTLCVPLAPLVAVVVNKETAAVADLLYGSRIGSSSAGKMRFTTE